MSFWASHGRPIRHDKHAPSCWQLCANARRCRCSRRRPELEAGRVSMSACVSRHSTSSRCGAHRYPTQAHIVGTAAVGGSSSTPAGRRREVLASAASSCSLGACRRRRLSCRPVSTPGTCRSPGSRGAPRLDLPVPVGATGVRRLSGPLVEDRNRSGSPRTARHHRTRVQLTTRSSAAAADHQPGLRRFVRVTRRRSPVMMLRRPSAGAIC